MEQMIFAKITVADGAVELFHNNSKKFKTASNGAIVTAS